MLFGRTTSPGGRRQAFHERQCDSVQRWNFGGQTMSSRLIEAKLALCLLLTFLLTTSIIGAPAQIATPLLDLRGKPVDPFKRAGTKLLAFAFIRKDCPVANAYAPELQRLQACFTPQGVTFYLVYPDADETPEGIRAHMREFGYRWEALRDPKHAFAKRARVTITPEVALFRPDGKLLYHGRIDDRYVDFGKARPEPMRREFADALDRALNGKTVMPATGSAVGCFIEK
jgi:hypothetical protein